ncbi:MAG: endonuclease domain-containing protein [Pseudooceanicola sp.]|nr:endonuclease domain-containing protein [Pseudooceanicola sp.]
MTAAEKRLWYRLRAHRFLGLSIRRQAPIGPFIADFLIPAHRLIIEVDGGRHGGVPDMARDAWLAGCGYHTLRFWNDEVMCNLPGVLQRIAEEVAE